MNQTLRAIAQELNEHGYHTTTTDTLYITNPQLTKTITLTIKNTTLHLKNPQTNIDLNHPNSIEHLINEINTRFKNAL